MNEFTDKNEQDFLDACGAIGVEPNAMVNTQKERYLVSEFLKNPVSWLETESLYHSYTTRDRHILPVQIEFDVLASGALRQAVVCFA